MRGNMRVKGTPRGFRPGVSLLSGFS